MKKDVSDNLFLFFMMIIAWVVAILGGVLIGMLAKQAVIMVGFYLKMLAS